MREPIPETPPTYKILHAEDDPEWAALVARRLKGPSYRLFAAQDGAEALTLAAEAMPDLAILDVRLPDVTGHELCRRLREIEGLDRLPIIVLSAHASEKIPSLTLGADAFVYKDSGAEELPATVEALLRRVRMDIGIIAKNDLTLDPRGRKVLLGGRHVATLTRKQFLFLRAIVKKSPAPISEDELRRELSMEAGDPEGSRSFIMLAARTRAQLGKMLGGRIKGSRRFGWLYIAEAR